MKVVVIGGTGLIVRNDQSLMPGANPRLGATSFEQWVEKRCRAVEWAALECGIVQDYRARVIAQAWVLRRPASPSETIMLACCVTLPTMALPPSCTDTFCTVTAGAPLLR